MPTESPSSQSLKRELRLLIEEADLSQRDLADILGTSDMTVNRWLSDRKDALEPPFYALQFLRVFIMLPEAARMRLPRKSHEAKRAAGEEPEPPIKLAARRKTA